MLILLSIFVSVWSFFFDWKKICAGFFYNFYYICIAVVDPVIKKGGFRIPLTGLTPPQFCLSHVRICNQWVQFRCEVIVRFVDINGIDDYHCLKLSFHNSNTTDLRRVWRYQREVIRIRISKKTDNTMVKGKSTKGQTTIYKTYI